MPATIPDDVRALITEPIFFHAATINPDGSPQVSVVWADLDGDRFVFSTAEGRVKPRNLRRDPRITISFTAPDNPYRNIVLQGRAVEIENRGMASHRPHGQKVHRQRSLSMVAARRSARRYRSRDRSRERLTPVGIGTG